MKRAVLLAFSVLILQTVPANANTTCSMVGSHVICTDSGSGTQTTCRQVGNQILCW